MLVLARRPPSSNKGPNHLFQRELSDAAQISWGGQPMLSGALYARIVWFHNYATTQDVDNIAKNVLDAVKGVIVADDSSIYKCLIHKVDARQSFTIVERSDEADATANLVTLLAEGARDILILQIGSVESDDVTFGPIDGGST